MDFLITSVGMQGKKHFEYGRYAIPVSWCGGCFNFLKANPWHCELLLPFSYLWKGDYWNDHHQPTILLENRVWVREGDKQSILVLPSNRERTIGILHLLYHQSHGGFSYGIALLSKKLRIFGWWNMGAYVWFCLDQDNSLSIKSPILILLGI